MLDAADWADGRLTAGVQSAEVKTNEQLPARPHPCRRSGAGAARARRVRGVYVGRAAATHPAADVQSLLNGAGLRRPCGQRDPGDPGEGVIPGTGETLRTDLSCTLFLADREEYEGGALIIEDRYGAQSVKPPAADMAVYSSTSLHRVMPAADGARVASVCWAQSMERSDAHHSALFDRDQSIQTPAAERGANNLVCLWLTGVYHSMIRAFAEI
jgi:PKHD-type hydroxylase